MLPFPLPTPKSHAKWEGWIGDDLVTMESWAMQDLVSDSCLRNQKARSSREQHVACGKEQRGSLSTACSSRAAGHASHRPDEGCMEESELVSPWKGSIQYHCLELSDPIDGVSVGWLPEASVNRSQLKYVLPTSGNCWWGFPIGDFQRTTRLFMGEIASIWSLPHQRAPLQLHQSSKNFCALNIPPLPNPHSHIQPRKSEVSW